jgi:hypothetical protein
LHLVYKHGAAQASDETVGVGTRGLSGDEIVERDDRCRVIARCDLLVRVLFPTCLAPSTSTTRL